MRPNTAPLTQMHACRCGQAHPALTRLAGLFLLVCPDVDDDALHFIPPVKTAPPYLVMGPSGSTRVTRAIILLEQDLLALRDRVAALEGKKEKKG